MFPFKKKSDTTDEKPNNLHDLITKKNWKAALQFVKDPKNNALLNDMYDKQNLGTPLYRVIVLGKMDLATALINAGVDPAQIYFDNALPNFPAKPIVFRILETISCSSSIIWKETQTLFDTMLEKKTLNQLLLADSNNQSIDYKNDLISFCFTKMNKIDKKKQSKEEQKQKQTINEHLFQTLTYFQSKGLQIMTSKFTEGNIIAHIIKNANKQAAINLLKLAENETTEVALKNFYSQDELLEILESKNEDIGIIRNENGSYLKIKNKKYPLTFTQNNDINHATVPHYINKNVFFEKFLSGSDNEIPVWLLSIPELSKLSYSPYTKEQLSTILTFLREVAIESLNEKENTIAGSKHEFNNLINTISQFIKVIFEKLNPAAQEVYSLKRSGKDPKAELSNKNKFALVFNQETDLFAQKIFEWLLPLLDILRCLPANQLPLADSSNEFTKAVSHLLRLISEEIVQSKFRSENFKAKDYGIGFVDNDARIEAEKKFNEIKDLIDSFSKQQGTENNSQENSVIGPNLFIPIHSLDMQIKCAQKTLEDYKKLSNKQLKDYINKKDNIENLLNALSKNFEDKSGATKAFNYWQKNFDFLFEAGVFSLIETHYDNEPILLIAAKKFQNKYLVEFLLDYVDQEYPTKPFAKITKSELGESGIRPFIYGGNEMITTGENKEKTSFKHPGILFPLLQFLMNSDSSHSPIQHKAKQTAMALMKWIAKKEFPKLENNSIKKDFLQVFETLEKAYGTFKTYLDENGLDRVDKFNVVTKKRQSSKLREGVKSIAIQFGSGDSLLVIRMTEWFSSTIKVALSMPEETVTTNNILLLQFILKKIHEELQNKYNEEKQNPKKYKGIPWSKQNTSENLQTLLDDIKQQIDKLSTLSFANQTQTQTSNRNPNPPQKAPIGHGSTFQKNNMSQGNLKSEVEDNTDHDDLESDSSNLAEFDFNY